MAGRPPPRPARPREGAGPESLVGLRRRRAGRDLRQTTSPLCSWFPYWKEEGELTLATVAMATMVITAVGFLGPWAACNVLTSLILVTTQEVGGIIMSTSQMRTQRFQAMNQPVQGPIESRSTRGKGSWTSGPTTSPIFMCGRDLGAREGVSPFLTRSARGRVPQTCSDPSSATHTLGALGQISQLRSLSLYAFGQHVAHRRNSINIYQRNE